ncbi:MAG: flagellar hook-basal body complex protein [Desulfobulbaceae bacterium]|nr:flagellar hook-basal body complex protein [Desulfobulbaceae bacterium]HIJ91466.1 flagellar hook-basal body complex protein [Deltaproteobacteria bacterium]
MGVSSSLYASISGLSTMGNAMSVLGDNVSNVNTIAFKSSRATFQDVLSQSVATAAGAAQVGRGVTMTTIDGIFAQGSFESTSTPTDLAIGGQGFFMLRAPGSAESDMYTRAGEFRFDKEGYLVNPTGNFVQGWTINPTSGEVEGTIGDINLGKSTPPVETSGIQVIANVDSRKNNEVNEMRLFEAWDGTNPALPVPVSPIDANAYEYTTAIKVYDSVGASHDLTVYFDRTTKDNQWEYLVTCEPSEDQRRLGSGRDATGALDGSNDEESIYTPDTTYNYVNHKGAGALMYGVIDFSTSGSIDNIWAWNVPPDGKVDPALNTNRKVLGNTDQYYSFDANFTGAATNQQITLNLGARYSGQSTAISEIIVSNGKAYSNASASTAITKETLWSTVYDSSGNLVNPAAVVTFAGYDNQGREVSGSYALTASGKVQDLLTALDATFQCTSTIDADGRIKMTDDTGGDSGMAVTSFIFGSGTNPFGGVSLTVAGIASGTDADYFTTDGTSIATAATASLTSLRDSSGRVILPGDAYRFSGTAVDGTVFAGAAGTTFTVGTTGSTMQELLDFLSDLYANGAVVGPPPVASPDVSATLGTDGRIHLVDNTGGSSLAVTLDTTTGPSPEPLGAVTITSLNPSTVMYTDAATTVPATAATLLTNVYDAAGLRVSVGDVYTFTGLDSANVAIPAGTTFTVAAGSTVQNLLDFIATTYNDTITFAGGAITPTDVDVDIDVAYAHTTALPLGANATAFAASSVSASQINITTSKQQIISTERALSSATGLPPVISASTPLISVFDSAGNRLATGDTIVFQGTRGDGTAVNATYTVGTSYASPYTAGSGQYATVQEMLSWLESQFDAEASIDGAGRLVLTDRTADEIATGLVSSLSVTSIDYTGVASGAEPFGTGTFTTITADSAEDGSRSGDTVSIDFSTEALSTTQYANSSTTIFQDQDGFAAGFLQSVSVDTSGIITGNYSNGQVLEKAQVALASFNNLAGLRKEGGNVFRETTGSGAPITGAPGTNGLGSISPNSLEQSNVDLGAEFVKLITTQRGFQANSKIITTTDEMLSDLINIKR